MRWISSSYCCVVQPLPSKIRAIATAPPFDTPNRDDVGHILRMVVHETTSRKRTLHLSQQSRSAAPFVERLLVWLDRPGRAQRTWGRWPVVRMVYGSSILVVSPTTRHEL